MSDCACTLSTCRSKAVLHRCDEPLGHQLHDRAERLGGIHGHADLLWFGPQCLEHDRATELTTTLGEIAAITRLRLDRLVSDVSHAASHGESLPS